MSPLSVLTQPYPQKQDSANRSWLDRMADRIGTALRARVRLGRGRLERFAARVELEQSKWRALPAPERMAAARLVRVELRRLGIGDEGIAARTLGLARLTAASTLGLSAHPNQIMGAWVLLNRQAAEMDTGEGKTLTAALAAGCAALSGLRVHVVTVNDYLARRDAEALAPYFSALGLTVAALGEAMDPEAKRAAYASDVLYGANKVIVFDYLRDRIAMGERGRPSALELDRLAQGGRTATLLPGLQFAIVDEADSVFIDEARTPLIISAERRDRTMEMHLEQAISLARQLVEEDDFVLLEGPGPRLTDGGRSRLASLARELGGIWTGPIRREEAVLRALSALHRFRRDVDYIVRDGKVLIVDEHTGRVMPDRSWERGLHQLIEIKEGLQPGPVKETLARLSYQLFFRRYLNLSGMSGTCREVFGELGEVYGLGVVRLAPHRPSRRKRLPTRIFPRSGERWQAVAAEVVKRHARGQPVLIGTRSILASEQMSTCLRAASIEHLVLNAKQDAQEAAVVAQAGARGQVTIATNMAGRGTDVRLGPGVEALGGLHVILTEGHDNGRVDRQFAGRCARQGDPGSWQCMLSLQDEVPSRLPRALIGLAGAWLTRAPQSGLAHAFAALLYRIAQWRVARRHSQIRRTLMRTDERTRRALSFSGSSE